MNFIDIVFTVFLSCWGRTCTGNQPTQQHARSRRSAYAPADDSEGTFFLFQKFKSVLKLENALRYLCFDR